MYEQDPRIKKYVNAVQRHLRMPWDVRTRVMSDFGSSVSARREAGESVEEILKSLGTPKQAARELNKQMKEYTYRKSPWRYVFLFLAVICGIILLGELFSMAVVWYMTGSEAATLGVIGGADGPTAVFVTTKVEGLPEEVKLALCIIGLAAGIFGYWKSKRLKRE